MNFTDFCSKTEFSIIQNKIMEKQNFEHKRTVKVRDGTVRFLFYGERIDKDLAKKIWHGENYIVGIDISCMRTNNHSGGGGAYSRSEILSMEYSDFVQMCEGWSKGHVPSDYVYWQNYNEQLSLF